MERKIFFKFFRVRIFCIVLFLCTLIHCSSKPAAEEKIEKIVYNVSSRIMCMCKDNCNKVLVNCNCTYSDDYRNEIREFARKGENEDQIVKRYVDRYGEVVLAAPTMQGFNLTAWVMPVMAIFAGGGALWMLLSRWRKTINPQPSMVLEEEKPDEQAPLAEKAKKAKTNDLTEKLEEELNNFDF